MNFLTKLLKPKPPVIPEQSFKYCLSKVKTKARVIRGKKLVIEVRPLKVDDFKKVLDEHGVTNEAVDKAIQHLNTNPSEFIRFVHADTISTS